jgi:hypothetical protein
MSVLIHGALVAWRRVGRDGLLCVPARRRSLRQASGRIGVVRYGRAVRFGVVDGVILGERDSVMG